MKNLVLIIITFCSFIIFGQADIFGVWDTGDENTKIELSESNGLITGKIKSSDNKKAKIGRVILKDLQKNGSKWMGKIYAARRGEWHDVEITPKEDVLQLKISAGLFSKSLEWKKSK
jgi:hypothetical protein